MRVSYSCTGILRQVFTQFWDWYLDTFYGWSSKHSIKLQLSKWVFSLKLTEYVSLKISTLLHYMFHGHCPGPVGLWSCHTVSVNDLQHSNETPSSGVRDTDQPMTIITRIRTPLILYLELVTKLQIGQAVVMLSSKLQWLQKING